MPKAEGLPGGHGRGGHPGAIQGDPSLNLPPLHAQGSAGPSSAAFLPPLPTLDPDQLRRRDFYRRVNSDWDQHYGGSLPPSNPRVAFQGEDGSRIPIRAESLPGNPLNRTGLNEDLWNLIDRNRQAVREERRAQGEV